MHNDRTAETSDNDGAGRESGKLSDITKHGVSNDVAGYIPPWPSVHAGGDTSLA